METRKPIPQKTQQQYLHLRAQWEEETMVLSNLSKAAEHPAFQGILALGYELAIPLILADLISHPSWVVIALRMLHPEGPDRQPKPGVIGDIIQAWLEWGARTGMIGKLDQSLIETADLEPEHEEVGTFDVIVQEWIETERGTGIRPDGYSLHLNDLHRQRFIAAYWESMPSSIPDIYSKPMGRPYTTEVDPRTYKEIQTSTYGIREYQGQPVRKK